MIRPIKFPYHPALVLILLVGLFIRLETLTSSPLWFDEAMEYWVATAPVDNLFPTVQAALQDPPLYSLLLHFWMNLGRDEFSLRLLSTFGSLLSIPVGYTLGKQVQNRLTGIIAALFFAFLPPNIRFAQEVGQYAFLILLLLTNLLMIFKVRHTNRWQYWIGWFTTALFALYTHYGSILIIAATTGLLLLENLFQRKKNWLGRQLIVSIPLIVLALPLFVFWLPTQLLRGPTSEAFQIDFNSISVETITFVERTRSMLGYQITGLVPDPTLRASLRLAAAILLLLALLTALYRLRNSPKQAPVFIWLLASWSLFYAAGRIGLYPYSGSRHALILAPLLLTAVSIGVASLWKRQPLLGLTLLSSFAIIALLSPGESSQDLRTVTDYYLLTRQEIQPTYVLYGAVPGFRYQLELKTGFSPDLPAIWYINCWSGEPEPYCREENIYYGRWMRQLSSEEQHAEILSNIDAASPSGFWLIIANISRDEKRQLLDTLNANHRILDSIEASGASAYHFQARGQ